MMKKRRNTWGIFGIIVLALISIIGLVNLLRPPRDNYGEIDFEHDAWMSDFVTDYQTGIAQADDWVKDARMVALRVAGYPNSDNTSPAQVTYETDQDSKVTVTILSKRLMDDSIARQETRVELIKDGTIWRIIWAGVKQQCGRDGFDFMWTTSPCS